MNVMLVQWLRAERYKVIACWEGLLADCELIQSIFFGGVLGIDPAY